MLNSASAQPSKYQKGEERHILRSQIHEAPYNPRIIGEGAEKRLQQKIKKTGLIGTLIWNERSGNLVSGHQRLKALDRLEGYPTKKADYTVRATVVDLSDKEEREMNVFMNNPSVQGEWDLDKLAGLILDDGISPDEMGMTETDIQFMFGGDPSFDGLFAEPEEMIASKEQIEKIKEHRSASTEKMKEEQNAEFFFIVVCQSEQAKNDLLRAVSSPVNERYVNGAILARKLGVTLNAK